MRRVMVVKLGKVDLLRSTRWPWWTSLYLKPDEQQIPELFSESTRNVASSPIYMCAASLSRQRACESEYAVGLGVEKDGGDGVVKEKV